MTIIDGIDLAEDVDRAQHSQESYIQRKLAENSSSRFHDYVILLAKGDEVVEDRFEGTPSQRLEYLENPATHDVLPGLGLNLEADKWAAGYYDRTDRAWKVCGNDLALRHMIATRPRPVS